MSDTRGYFPCVVDAKEILGYSEDVRGPCEIRRIAGNMILIACDNDGCDEITAFA